MEGISLITEKISQYNLLTNIIPGTLLCLTLEYVVRYNILISDNWYLMGIIFYFTGVVNNRFGSLIIELILKKTKIISMAPYELFLEAEQSDPKINELNTENNIFRSYIAVFSLSLLAMGYKFISIHFLPCLEIWKEFIVLIGLLILFIFSYRKQTDYIKNRVLRKTESH